MFLKACLLSFAVAGLASAAAAPALTLKDAQGHTVNLARLRGKVVVLDFWATWCHGCKTEIPWFMEFIERYRHKGLAVVGVAMDEDGWKAVRPFVKSWKVNYPVVLGNDDVAARFGAGDVLPVTLLIDRRGEIVDSHEGVIDRDAWEKRIRELLGVPAQ